MTFWNIIRQAGYVPIIFAFTLMYGNASAQKKPEIKLKCSQREIEQGDSVNISWTSSKTDSIIFSNTGEKLPLNGQFSLRPDSTVDYMFIAYRGRKGVTKRKSAVTVYPPYIVNFSLPATASDEYLFTIGWNAKYAQKVIIDSINDSLPVSGELKYQIDTTRSFRITAQNRFGVKVSQEKKVEISYDEELIYPANILLGDPVKIKWKYKNTKEVRIQGFDTIFRAIDTLVLIPDTSLSFDLYAIRHNGDTLVNNIKIKVTVPNIILFEATRRIFFGEEAEIKWKAIGVDRVSIKGISDSLPPEGSMKVKPVKTQTYVMSITSAGRVEVKTQIVNVFLRNYIIDQKDIKDVSSGTRIDFEIYNTDITKYPKEVKLFVLAVDTAGNFVSGLAPPFGSEATSKKFFSSLVETLANGNKHKVESFSVKEVSEDIMDTCSISLTLDYSGSMDGCVSVLEKACNVYAKKKREVDSVAVVKFDEDLSLELPLTVDSKSIQKSISKNGMGVFGGGTALYAAADEGLLSLRTSRKNKQMILITDGYENSSLFYFGERAIFAQQVAKIAKKTKVKVNVVTVGDNVNEPLLKFLSVITGGNYYNIMNPNDIVKVMTELPMLNRSYYVITYKPSVLDGSRNVSLIYDNNLSEKKEAKRDVFVGDKFDMNQFESNADSYWTDTIYSWGSKMPMGPPQAIVNFDFSKHNIKDEYYTRMDKFAELMIEDKTICVTIVGHTDLVGSENDCYALSLNRAKEVMEYMVKKGISPKRMRIVGDGKDHPVWPYDRDPYKARENRRVEFILFK